MVEKSFGLPYQTVTQNIHIIPSCLLYNWTFFSGEAKRGTKVIGIKYSKQYKEGPRKVFFGQRESPVCIGEAVWPCAGLSCIRT